MTASPYLVGAGIGLLDAFAFATAKRGLGVTTAFESGAAIGGRRLLPDVMNVNAYVKERDEAPKIDWESYLVAGVLLGSFFAARTTMTKKTRWRRRRRPDALTPARYATSFLGGALMMFGARMAKGCTSGHGITGMMQLALSSWVFTPAIFATSVGVAHLLHRKGRR